MALGVEPLDLQPRTAKNACAAGLAVTHKFFSGKAGRRYKASPKRVSDIGAVYSIVVVVVFTFKTVLTSIQYPSLSYSSRQRNEFPWSHANPK